MPARGGYFSRLSCYGAEDGLGNLKLVTTGHPPRGNAGEGLKYLETRRFSTLWRPGMKVSQEGRDGRGFPVKKTPTVKVNTPNHCGCASAGHHQS